jgi:carbon starvation protein
VPLVLCVRIIQIGCQYSVNTMTAILLILSALGVFVLGYRFFAKFLVLGVFRLQQDTPTPAEQRADGRDFIPSPRVLLLGQHAAGAVGILSVVGVAVALVWGWVPAFLWVVVGTLLAGGTHAMGALWASLRRSGDSLASVSFDLTGIPGAMSLYFLGVALLVIVSVLLSVLIGSLLRAHPEAAWAFLALLPATAVARRGAADAAWPVAVLFYLGALSLFFIALIAGQYLPLSLAGSWILTSGDVELLLLTDDLAWSLLALAFTYLSIKHPVDRTARPRGLLVTCLLIITIAAAIVGIALAQPELAAPQFQRDADLPSPLVLLFIVVTGGALSGVHGLLASGPTVRQLPSHGDAPVIAFGGTLLDGLLAVCVVVALAAGFSSADDWLALYGLWPEQASLFAWLDLAVVKLGLFIAAAGLPLPWAVALVAAVFAGLALTMLENAARALAFSIDEFVEDFDLAALKAPLFRERMVLAALVVGSVALSQTDPALEHWLLLGLTNLWFATTVLLMLALILLKLDRPPVFALAPVVVLAPLLLWGTAWVLNEYWQSGSWFLLGVSAVVVALAACTAGVTLLAVLAQRRRQAGTGLAAPRGP